MTKYFICAWDVPIYGLISPGQVRELADVTREGVTLEVGSGHQNFRGARTIVDQRRKRIEDMEAVFVGIRNPYDIAVSTYHFLRETYRDNHDKVNFVRANRHTFEEFWCGKEGKARPQKWLTMEGEVPDNLKVIRFENLREDLGALAAEFGFREAELPHLNSSNRGHYREYMTGAVEKAVYKHFGYLFECGYYEREVFD